ncbi:uncharacterized protein PHACADRAFT_211403 [Phanerochaete carnosa HHB-10118-sp]|uniref:Uncharacterized protein n=1 Tax=Phanerochaete carnosa (strain HHB-10118-sp) TaxID=650164 RepID=K5WTJ2_PHACS|nr:uncharacterized protein PHACADRAFT_211403 [Phanerochaete carnosa HHB-10118-sp]EKM53747.1 hypothetical protein PHACADRAFT_211403 [Phanerochaete carnosa HHB-10118-sp]
MSPELAWTVLLKHMDEASQSRVFVRHVHRHPDDISLLPSWKEFMQHDSEGSDHLLYLNVLALSLLDTSLLHTHEPGTYCYNAPSYGPVRIVRDEEEDEGEDGCETLQIQVQDASDHYETQKCTKVNGTFLQDVEYAALKLSVDLWLVVEVIGMQQIAEYTALVVVKRGCIFPSSDSLLPDRYVLVVHLSDEQAGAWLIDIATRATSSANL